jgi:1,4-dihydroxy-2-naphthoyl-CoA synthase
MLALTQGEAWIFLVHGIEPHSVVNFFRPWLVLKLSAFLHRARHVKIASVLTLLGLLTHLLLFDRTKLGKTAQCVGVLRIEITVASVQGVYVAEHQVMPLPVLESVSRLVHFRIWVLLMLLV